MSRRLACAEIRYECPLPGLPDHSPDVGRNSYKVDSSQKVDLCNGGFG
jgi:hypothetical protein